MLPFETLTELFELAMSSWSNSAWAHAAKPTPGSVARIQRELGIRIPEDLVRLAAACPSYGSWFASIGDDFDNGLHITKLNELFHTNEDGAPLPRCFIMLNQGHDGHCDCWDTRAVTQSGENLIVYICMEARTLEPDGTPYDSFRAYAEDLALNHARYIPDKTKRRKAARLIEEFEGRPGA